MKLKGKVWKFGDNISTDHIAPGRYFHLRSNLNEFSKHVLEDARKDFADKVNKGDIIVGGKNFGLGSSREHAPRIIKLSGVSCIIAESFARIFYRNSINIGLPVIELKEANEINEGDILEIDTEKGIIKNITQKKEYTFIPFPEFMNKIIKIGGIDEYVKKYGDYGV
ncbi:3-isopropylmalate dehydratase small subunit [Marinitoga sp. 1197]|uniref:3-isopropylmalate dehydratase small subunit n=1 Tax=unclassified Marinitoga TaxID=2640159 RepID=UPI000640CEDD|nr:MULTISPECIES: 3-isopropylmalate dehydratase small subunit [unclassified Marinitoga]KLO22070.1 3-isopropylmalate dehydratase small subunit [Marinitoga sp. 1197]KLO24849.1 3-isopropylmalate dehydratase small subunit [Marinitoga sp. 1155]NUU98776.1 3-isopropylmalate dehydratase [Marinitoga sp. 1154]